MSNTFCLIKLKPYMIVETGYEYRPFPISTRRHLTLYTSLLFTFDTNILYIISYLDFSLIITYCIIINEVNF